MKLGKLFPKGHGSRSKRRASEPAARSIEMARKVKIPKHIGGVKIKKRHRKQLKALIRGIEKYEELVASVSPVLALLGVTKATEAAQSADSPSATAQ